MSGQNSARWRNEITDDLAPTVQIRRAQRDDIDCLAEFLAPFVASKKVLPRTSDELFYLISTGFVATDCRLQTDADTESNAHTESMIVGFATLEIYSHKLGEVRSLAVADSHRGLGVASQLVAACIDLAREKDVYEVMAITAADELFRRLGFDDALPDQKRALFLQTRPNM